LEPKVQGPVPIRSDSRNLFSFAESPQEKERRLDLERLAKIAADKKHQEELVQQKRQEDLLAAQLKHRLEHPEPPPVALAFMGKMGPPRAPIAILASGDGEVYTVRIGETFAGTYKLLELGYDAATIGFAEALVASHAEWAGRKTVLRMGTR